MSIAHSLYYPYKSHPYYSYTNFSKISHQIFNNDANHTTNNDFSKESKVSIEKKPLKNRYSKSTPISPVFFDISGFSNLEKPVLEILGIKLYQDDLIILALLFILYKENVNDEMLFISLILLLVS